MTPVQRAREAIERLEYEVASDGRLMTNGYEIFSKENVDTILLALRNIPEPVEVTPTHNKWLPPAPTGDE